MKRTLLLICTAVFFMALFGSSVRAVEEWKDTISLPVFQTIVPSNNENPNDFTVNYILTPDDAGNPMPKDSENGIYRFSVKGNSEYDIPFIEVTEQGIWHYTLSANGEGIKLAYSSLEIVIYGVFDGERFYANAFAKLPNGKKTDLNFTANVIPKVADISFEPSDEISELSEISEIPELSESSGRESGFSGDIVDTGDRNNSGLYFIIMSSALIILLMIQKPKRSKKYQ